MVSSLLPYLLNILVWARAFRQENEIKGIQIERKKQNFIHR